MGFNIDLENVLFGIKDDKVTVYVLNDKKTAVRTIDELENNQGGRKVLCTEPHEVRNEMSRLDRQFDNRIDRIKELPIRRKLKNLKIAEVEEQRKQAIKDFMKPYNELYKGEVEFVEGIRHCSFRYVDGDFVDVVDDRLDVVRCEAEYHFKDNLDEKLASASKNNHNGFLYYAETDFFPYHIESFEELKKIEKDIQVAYDKELKRQKEDIQKKQATEKLLDF